MTNPTMYIKSTLCHNIPYYTQWTVKFLKTNEIISTVINKHSAINYTTLKITVGLAESNDWVYD